MTGNSAIRGCTNWTWWNPVYQPNSTACLNYCLANGAEACEYYAGNGECYVEFADGGCYVENGYPDWSAVVIP
jgi:hypothetical protein